MIQTKDVKLVSGAVVKCGCVRKCGNTITIKSPLNGGPYYDIDVESPDDRQISFLFKLDGLIELRDDLNVLINHAKEQK